MNIIESVIFCIGAATILIICFLAIAVKKGWAKMKVTLPSEKK